MKIVLINPSECIVMAIPNKRMFASFKAYFINEYITEKKMFNMIFPYYALQDAFILVPKEKIGSLDLPVMIEFIKAGRRIIIREWKVLE
jgi:hypothetical protein